MNFKTTGSHVMMHDNHSGKIMYHNVFANKTYFHNFESNGIVIFPFIRKPINYNKDLMKLVNIH